MRNAVYAERRATVAWALCRARMVNFAETWNLDSLSVWRGGENVGLLDFLSLARSNGERVPRTYPFPGNVLDNLEVI
jgi:hypothetical protein